MDDTTWDIPISNLLTSLQRIVNLIYFYIILEWCRNESKLSNVKEEMDEIRREITRISGELESLKEGMVKAPPEAPYVPEDVGDLIEYLERRLPDKPDTGMAYFGAIERRGGKIVSSYHSGWGIEDILKCSPRRVANLLSPFSNEQRILILKSLIEKKDRGSSELSQATGLEGGQLYHHLKELALAEYVEQKERGVYALTEKGKMALLTVLAMTATLEKKAIPEEIGEAFRSGH
jgi:DNA-binding HxlR family transcriptional regulator